MKLGFRAWAWLGLGLAGLSGLGATQGCGGSDGTGGGCDEELGKDGCFNEACYKPGKARSFKTDVLPIFEQSCSLSASCHGNPQSPNNPSTGYQPYLGEVNPDMKPSDVAKILGLIVSQPSPTATNLRIVDPGKPESSFLMQKMDGAVMCSTTTCAFNTCGLTMPQGSMPLPIATRNVVRDWIKQGAQNN